jgi:phage shock protein C
VTIANGAFYQHLAHSPCPVVALELGLSANHLKNMKREKLARDVLKVVHPGRAVRPLRRKELDMQNIPHNPFTRGDTVLGICEALGEDFRFSPLLLRVVFAIGLFINPVATIGAYLGLGVLVLLSRLLVPNPRRPKVVAAPEAEGEAAEAAPQPLHADNEADALPVAA